MVRHTLEQREFIVRRLAAFDTPRAITIAFTANFPGTPCSEQDVLASDPRVSIVPPELFLLFRSETAAYLAQDPLFADQRARLHVLSKQVEDAISRNDQAGARAIFRQIAEEKGDIGTKGGAARVPAAPVAGEEITAITRTVVDPAPVE